jgi:sec-independent protein translocase protein TatB
MLNIGPQELLIVLALALIVVGPTKLPELSRQLGRGLREFRKVQDEVKGMVKVELDEKEPPRRRPTPAASRGVHRTSKPANGLGEITSTAPPEASQPTPFDPGPAGGGGPVGE